MSNTLRTLIEEFEIVGREILNLKLLGNKITRNAKTRLLTRELRLKTLQEKIKFYGAGARGNIWEVKFHVYDTPFGTKPVRTYLRDLHESDVPREVAEAYLNLYNKSVPPEKKVRMVPGSFQSKKLPMGCHEALEDFLKEKVLRKYP